jgi:hypothetical protein
MLRNPMPNLNMIVHPNQPSNPPLILNPPLLCNVEARSASTAALSSRDPSHLELASDQLHRVIHIASLQQIQARLIHDDCRLVAIALLLILKDRVLLRIDVLDVDQAHEVLKAVAATRFYRHS